MTPEKMEEAAPSKQVMTIRGICRHGKVRFMAVDEPRVIDAKVKREIGKMVAAGYTMDRVTVEEARKSDMHCQACGDKP
jgi:hypothetical protein